MNPSLNRNATSNDNASSSGVGTSIRPSAPPEGSEGGLPTRESPNTDMETEKPSRAGQIGEGSYEGTPGYAKGIKSYLRANDVDKAAAAVAPSSKSDARDMLAAEFEAASRSKAPGQ